MFGIRLFFKKLLQKNEVNNSYFESKSNPFSIFNKTIDGKTAIAKNQKARLEVCGVVGDMGGSNQGYECVI